MNNIEKLIKPEMASLGEYGIELYNNMIKNERNAIFKYTKNGVFYVFYDLKAPPVQINEITEFDDIEHRAKTLVITEHSFNYKEFTDELYHSRKEFLNHLQLIAKEQNLDIKNIGARSTSEPKLIDFNAKHIKYSCNKAYRSSNLEFNDIIDLINYREKKLSDSLKNSRKKYQHERVSNYEERLNELQKSKLELQSIKTKITGRALSGISLKLRAKNEKETTKNFGIKHITVIFANNPSLVTVEASKTKKRPSKYDAPILIIEELKIEICKAP